MIGNAGGAERSSRLQFLRRVVQKRDSTLQYAVDKLEKRSIDAAEIELLRELLADELVEFGLREDDEPTPYGLELESLSDWVGRAGQGR